MTEQQTGKAPTSPTFPDKGESAPQQQETLAPQAMAGRKYRALKMGEYISRCGYILPNALQCWKAGEEEVTDKGPDGHERSYQLCERHAKIQRAIDIGAMKAEHVDTVFKEQTVFIPNVPMQDAPEEAKAPEKEQKKEKEDEDEDKKPQTQAPHHPQVQQQVKK